MPDISPPFAQDASLITRMFAGHPVFDRQVYLALKPLALSLAVAFGIFVILGFIDSEAGEDHIYIIATDALTMLIFFLCFYLLQKDIIQQNLTYPVGITFISLALFNVLLAFWFTRNAFFLSYLPMLVLGCGAFMLSLQYALLSFVIISVPSILVASIILPELTVFRYSPALIGSLLVSLLILVVRRQHVIESQRALLAMQAEAEERKKAEEHLAHAQRLESIGKLVSSIAHDFNNLLMVMLGYTDSLLHDNKANEKLHNDLTSVRMAGEKAAALAAKLLAFSRQQVMQLETIGINELVRSVQPLIIKSVPDNIEISLELADEVGAVRVDPLQMEQVILNLALNAKDAIGDNRGEISIRTRRTGDAVVLEVIDNGCGISADIRDQIFEPFYTTKAAGGGTGLGLSMVHGIVTQSGGNIDVASSPGNGSTFRIKLKHHAASTETPEPAEPVNRETISEITVFVVDDDNEVRKIVTRILESKGFDVMNADSAEQALKLAEIKPFDFLLTDVVMPGKSGIELVQELRAAGYATPTLLMSGYAADELGTVSTIEYPLINKPFGAVELIDAISEVIAAAETQRV